MIKKVFLILIFCLLANGLFGRTVRVATYNLGNYLVADRWIDGRFTKMYPKPECEKEAVRMVTNTVKPDVLVVQEIGGDLFLKELQADLKTVGLDYPYIFLVKGADSIRHIGVLSKETFVQTISHDGLYFKFFKNDKMPVRRGLLELRFKTEGVEWGLFGVHLKSRRWDKPQDYESLKQRLGEATVIRDKIKERYPDSSKSHYLIVGDFNDSPRSKTLKRFLKPGKVQLAVMLPAEDSRKEVWTHYREGHGVYSRIDYILVSPFLLGRVKAGVAAIADCSVALKASDHRMVYVDLEF